MESLTLKWDKKSLNGQDVFYIVCQKYGTVGVVEGTLHEEEDFHISWLYIEPFFRIKNGVKILMQLLKREIPLHNISKITYDCPERSSNPHVGSKFEDFMREEAVK